MPNLDFVFLFSETSPAISQIIPYFGWMVENLFGFEGSHDGNILLVIDSLLRNPFVNVMPIVGQLSNYITQRLHQKIDLGTAAKFQFEKTIQGSFHKNSPKSTYINPMDYKL